MAADLMHFALRQWATRDIDIFCSDFRNELAHMVYASYVEGAMSLANKLIANGVFDEESVLISTITSINVFVHSWADMLPSTPTDYWRMVRFSLIGHTYTVGNFACRLYLHEDDNGEHVMYLYVEQGDSNARIYPKDSGKNPSKIIRDGKLVTGHYKFDDQIDSY